VFGQCFHSPSKFQKIWEILWICLTRPSLKSVPTGSVSPVGCILKEAPKGSSSRNLLQSLKLWILKMIWSSSDLWESSHLWASEQWTYGLVSSCPLQEQTVVPSFGDVIELEWSFELLGMSVIIHGFKPWYCTKSLLSNHISYFKTITLSSNIVSSHESEP
jgi:hypothetical protein